MKEIINEDETSTKTDELEVNNNESEDSLDVAEEISLFEGGTITPKEQ